MKEKILDLISAEIEKIEGIRNDTPQNNASDYIYLTGKLQALYDIWLKINNEIKE